ncbi:hypothetical protein H5P33_09710 [Mycolicibacterium arabiense]|nr:hypothetical protein [Mycolicibacterium arabiense]MCV7372987.1 hypothetical protein [Mycolicibacterium arabiense]
MDTVMRPWFNTGVALVGVGAIALAPISPVAPQQTLVQARTAAAAVSTEFELTAFELPYILTLPIVRQQIRNWAANWAVYLAGLGKAGVGAVDSLLAIPGVTVEVIQEVLALNFVGAFDTITTAIRDSVVAVGQPLLDSLIWRNQKFYAVQTALEAAVPKAWIDLANGFLAAGNVVTTSLIVGTQNLISAVLTFNLGNIIDAAVEGTRNFFVALGEGAVAIVDGIEAAQFGIATALATPPPPSPFETAAVSDVAALRTLSTDTTISLAGGAQDAGSDTLVAEPPVEAEPVVAEDPVVTPPVADELETPIVADVPETPQEPTGATPSDEDATGPIDDDVDEEAEDAPTKDSGVKDTQPKDTQPKGDEPKGDEPKDAGPNNDTSANDDAGGAKSGSEDAE